MHKCSSCCSFAWRGCVSAINIHFVELEEKLGKVDRRRYLQVVPLGTTGEQMLRCSLDDDEIKFKLDELSCHGIIGWWLVVGIG